MFLWVFSFLKSDICCFGLVHVSMTIPSNHDDPKPLYISGVDCIHPHVLNPLKKGLNVYVVSVDVFSMFSHSSEINETMGLWSVLCMLDLLNESQQALFVIKCQYFLQYYNAYVILSSKSIFIKPWYHCTLSIPNIRNTFLILTCCTVLVCSGMKVKWPMSITFLCFCSVYLRCKHSWHTDRSMLNEVDI